MLNSKLLTIGALSVLVSGLIACSPDKKPDTWSVDAPQISIKAGSQIGFTDKSAPQTIDHAWSPSLREMSHRVLPSDADIVFPSLDSSSSFDVQVTASCTSGELAAHETKDLHQVGRFSLLSILPAAITVTALSKDSFYSCALDMDVQNKIGSIEHFSLPKVFIQNLDKVSSLNLEAFDNHQPIDDSIPILSYTGAHRYVLSAATTFGPSRVQMVCDLHTKTKSYSDMSEFHVDDLLPDDDVESALWRETCRVVITPDGHPENVRLSKRFILSKDVPQITVNRIPISCADFLNNVALHFEVKNPTDHPQMIGIHIPTNFQVTLNKFNFAGGADPATNDVTAATLTTISDAEGVTDSQNTTWLKVEAQATITVQSLIDQPLGRALCPGELQLTSFKFTEGASIAQPQIMQSGHYKNLMDVAGRSYMASDANIIYPLTTTETPFDPNRPSAIVNYQSTY